MGKTKDDNPATDRPPGEPVEAVGDALVRSAIAKQDRGETPTKNELRAFRRWQRERDERDRWRFYGAIPQKHWVRMSGRSCKVLREQSERYGIPFGERDINLAAVARALHDFLSSNRARLAADNGDGEMAAGPPSAALERWRRAKASMAELDLQERRNQLLPLDKVHEALGRLCAIMRTAGETLQRQHGPDALKILDDALDDYERQISKWIAKLKRTSDGP